MVIGHMPAMARCECDGLSDEVATHRYFRILNFFYKNIVAIGVLWWFQIYDGWSGN